MTDEDFTKVTDDIVDDVMPHIRSLEVADGRIVLMAVAEELASLALYDHTESVQERMLETLMDSCRQRFESYREFMKRRTN